MFIEMVLLLNWNTVNYKLEKIIPKFKLNKKYRFSNKKKNQFIPQTESA